MRPVLLVALALAVHGRRQLHQPNHARKHLQHGFEEDQLDVQYVDTDNLPGLASKVVWKGSPAETYQIYAGSATDTSSWVLLDTVVQSLHPTGDTPVATKQIAKKLTSHKDLIDGQDIIVCEGSGKTKCGSAKILDDYNRETWWPEAKHYPFVSSNGKLRSGGSFIAACKPDIYRGVLHTTESTNYTPSRTSYYGHSSAPHFTVHFNKNTKVATSYQHLPIDVASRALKNPPGGVQTNRNCAIQIEIATKAKESSSMPEAQKMELKGLIEWISTQLNIPMESTEYFSSYGSVQRFDGETWEKFSGWCGHQHVPENDHWDPGQIGAPPEENQGWETSTMYNDYGLKITTCWKDNAWVKCDWALTADLHENFKPRPPLFEAPIERHEIKRDKTRVELPSQVKLNSAKKTGKKHKRGLLPKWLQVLW